MTGLELAEFGWRLGDRADGVGEAIGGFLGSLPRPPRVLALGEPTHLAEELPLLRNRVFEQLVEHEGYRSIALETDCLAALRVDDHVAGGPSELDEVMATGFSHGWGPPPPTASWWRGCGAGTPRTIRTTG
jgi:erythromycin esterase-like protein